MTQLDYLALFFGVVGCGMALAGLAHDVKNDSGLGYYLLHSTALGLSVVSVALAVQ